MKNDTVYNFVKLQTFYIISNKQCPRNLYVENGIKCNYGQDYCVGGICRSRHLQCKENLGQGQSMWFQNN